MFFDQIFCLQGRKVGIFRQKLDIFILGEWIGAFRIHALHSPAVGSDFTLRDKIQHLCLGALPLDGQTHLKTNLLSQK